MYKNIIILLQPLVYFHIHNLDISLSYQNEDCRSKLTDGLRALIKISTKVSKSRSIVKYMTYFDMLRPLPDSLSG